MSALRENLVGSRRQLGHRWSGPRCHGVAVAILILVLVQAGIVHAQDGQLVVTRINDRFHMISMDEPGASTVLLYVGDEAALLVDSHWSIGTPAIRSAIAEITELPVRYVINTHWHPDHTDGNAVWRETGAIVFAHEAVRSPMVAGQMIEFFQIRVEPYPEEALPDITFDSRITLYLTGQEILVVHPSPAHTDGDAVVFFTDANVVHMGDTFLPSLYPFVDISSGGGVTGYLEIFDEVLAVADDATVVVPGHGQLSTTEELRTYRTMFATVYERVQAAVDEGQTLEEILANAPTAEFDARYSNPPFTSDVFVSTLYDVLARSSAGDLGESAARLD